MFKIYLNMFLNFERGRRKNRGEMVRCRGGKGEQ
jgi:hypothetical protein